jgi:predicted Zn-dependent protease
LLPPGGYVLVTRGMYALASSDEELAGVLAHEINHVVHRDHYTVIRQQELPGAGKDLISPRSAPVAASPPAWRAVTSRSTARRS